MESIVEQIAKEVMMKLKSDSANRGSAYAPLPAQRSSSITGTGNTAVILTANFKVIDQVINQLKTISPDGSSLILSTYVYENYGKDSISNGMRLVHQGNVPSHQALSGINSLIIPSMSVNSMSKAASLVADTYITRVLCYALSEGVKITVTDESIIDAARYFPAGVAGKIDKLRRELEEMGVTFQRSSSLKLAPSNSNSRTNPPIESYSSAPVASSRFKGDMPIKGNANSSAYPTDSSTSEIGTNTFGSSSVNCPDRIKEVIRAGAERVEKGLDTPIPGQEIAKHIDHTLLKANATREEIIKLCEEARENKFASVCVNPANVALAAQLLEGSGVMVCTVVGFPLGATSTFSKAMETRDAIANGATEIDMVINVGALKSKDYELVKNDIARVVESASGHTVKVILENSLLTDEEKVKACELSKLAGADFVKTSTGFSTGGATLEDVCLMRQTVGPSMGVKASGGIRDTETAVQMLQIGATRIGASASVAIVKNEKTAGKGY